MATEQELWLPARMLLRLRGKTLQVRLTNGATTKPRLMTVRDSIRLGYGETCEVNLGQGSGREGLKGEGARGIDGDQGPAPPVVIKLSRTQGMARLSSPLSPQDLGRFVELSVNGEPLVYPGQALPPGSQVDVVDKIAGRHFRMVVDPPSFLFRHPRWVAALAVLFLIISASYAAFLQWSLHDTSRRLHEAESRLGLAESGVRRAELGVQRAERSVSEALGRIESAQSQLVMALEGFRAERDEADRALQATFDSQIGVIRESFRERLVDVSREDIRGRADLEEEMRRKIEQVRGDLSGRMVQSYQHFKDREQAIQKSMAARLAAVEPESEVFKRVFGANREAVVFIHAQYRVRFGQGGGEKEFSTYGTGFLTSSDGEVVTARHVLVPWEYERQLAVLSQRGLAEVLPDSGRLTVWLTDRRVHNDDPENTIFYPEEGYRRQGGQGPLRILLVADPEEREVLVRAPFGLLGVTMPQAGHTDLAVFQIIDFERSFSHMTLAPRPLQVETLDEVMTLGYPFARLQKGMTVPQPSRGMVRRLGQELMELDTPMHPGLSGGPILNRQGKVIGMAVGVMESPVYGMAVRIEEIAKILKEARNKVRVDQQRLKNLGCDPGAIDGRIGRKTWKAYACEKAKGLGF